MKKFLLSLAAVFAIGTTAMAETATITFSEKYSENTVLTDELIKINDDVTVTFAKGNGSTAPQYYTNGTAVRWYGGNTMTVACPEGSITQIEIVFGTSDGSNAISADTGTFSSPNWTGSSSTVVFTEAGTSGNRRIAGLTVTYGEGGSTGGETPEQPDQPSNPGGDDDNKDGNVSQPFTTGLGFPDGSANVPKTATQYTATDTNIEYTLMGCYANSGYIMVNGKNYEGAFITWSLDFPMSQLQMVTSGSCSTNAASTVNVYAGENLIGNYAVNAQNATVTVEIPEEHQAAGTVYKVESGTTAFNQQFASFTYVKVGNEGETPDQPDPDQPENPTGTITVAEALAILAGGQTNVTATVKGIISQIDEVSPSYGNATYYIKDDLTDANALEVFRGKWMNGESFTAEDQIAVGGTIVVKGTLVNYNGTYEFTTGSEVISYEAPTGDVPTPPTPDEPTGNNVTFDFTNPTIYGFETADVTEINLPGENIASGVIDIAFTSLEGASTPIRFYASSGNWTLRFYKDTEMTITAEEGNCITGIVFDGTNLGKDWTYSAGSLTDKTWTPGEDDGDVTSLTIGKSATGNNPTIKTMTVYYDQATGVESVIAEDGEAVYYNLQGVRVNNPERGIFVKVQNGKAVKVVK